MRITVNKIKKITSDFGTSMIATIFMTFSLQIIAYPYLASVESPSQYGTILTLMGGINLLVVSLANSLNNVRLIQNNEYNKKKVVGDFNLLLLIATTISVLLISGFVLFYFEASSTKNLLLIAILIVLSMFRTYFMVSYRLSLNFLSNMIFSLVIGIGYIIGVSLHSVIKYWPLTFIIGELFGCTYLLLTTSLYKESFKRTVLFSITLERYIFLMITTLIGNLVLYLDRLLLFPSLGGDSVAVYQVSSFFGKSLGMAVIPISSVLLAYYTQNKFTMSLKKFWQINIIAIIASIIFFVISIFFSPWFTKLLYPTLFDEARPFIMLANLAAIISITGNITQPALLSFCNTSIQLVIQLVYGVVYVSAALISINIAGLYGFCIAAILSNAIRLVFMYFVGCLVNFENIK